MKREDFVAHRGYAGRYPENTLLSLEKAVEAGALHLECDLQLTADHIPVLFHDESLNRMTGKRGTITKTPFSELVNYSISHPKRFGGTFSSLRITPLREVVGFLRQNPAVTIFIEFKESSLSRFGTDFMVRIVLETVQPVLSQCVVISYNLDPLISARRMGWNRSGWVLKQFNNSHRWRAEEFFPDYLFCDHKLILPRKEGTLWKGSWKWVLFEIADPKLAQEWFELGADLVETMEIGTMLSACS